MYHRRKYLDPQDEPAVAYCEICQGEIYSTDECYPYRGGAICVECAEECSVETGTTPFTGAELEETWYGIFQYRYNKEDDQT